MSVGFSSVLVVEVMGAWLSVQPRQGLVFWEDTWLKGCLTGETAESEWSVSQTAVGREDCTQGMMGNKWLWGGRLRAYGDWQPARQFFVCMCALSLQVFWVKKTFEEKEKKQVSKSMFILKRGIHLFLH